MKKIAEKIRRIMQLSNKLGDKKSTIGECGVMPVNRGNIGREIMFFSHELFIKELLAKCFSYEHNRELAELTVKEINKNLEHLDAKDIDKLSQWFEQQIEETEDLRRSGDEIKFLLASFESYEIQYYRFQIDHAYDFSEKFFAELEESVKLFIKNVGTVEYLEVNVNRDHFSKYEYAVDNYGMRYNQVFFVKTDIIVGMNQIINHSSDLSLPLGKIIAYVLHYYDGHKGGKVKDFKGFVSGNGEKDLLYLGPLFLRTSSKAKFRARNFIEVKFELDVSETLQKFLGNSSNLTATNIIALYMDIKKFKLYEGKIFFKTDSHWKVYMDSLDFYKNEKELMAVELKKRYKIQLAGVNLLKHAVDPIYTEFLPKLEPDFAFVALKNGYYSLAENRVLGDVGVNTIYKLEQDNSEALSLNAELVDIFNKLEIKENRIILTGTIGSKFFFRRNLFFCLGEKINEHAAVEIFFDNESSFQEFFNNRWFLIAKLYCNHFDGKNYNDFEIVQFLFNKK